MTAETVSLNVDASGAAWIRVNRPERHNAMTAAMYEALLECIASAQADERVRCVLLQGEGGKSFISGTDISHFKDFTDGKQGIEYEAFVERVIDAVFSPFERDHCRRAHEADLARAMKLLQLED